MKKRVGIVLGGGISNGSLTANAKTRIQKALQLLRENKIQMLILSGKKSSSKRTEARLYYEYLVKNDVCKKSLLILEEKSEDTLGNAVCSKEIIVKKKLPKNIVVITSDYHLDRAIMLFKKIFGKGYHVTGIGSATPSSRFLALKEWLKKQIDKVRLAGMWRL